MGDNMIDNNRVESKIESDLLYLSTIKDSENENENITNFLSLITTLKTILTSIKGVD